MKAQGFEGFPNHECHGAARGFHALPAVCRRRAGLPAIHPDPGLHDHLAPGRDDDAGPAYQPPAVRPGGILLCLCRRGVGHRVGGLCRPLRPQAAAAVLLCRLHAGHPALRAGQHLSPAADGAHRHRPVRRGDRVDRAGHRHRPVRLPDARPGDGLYPDRLCRQPGAGPARRAVLRQPLELACPVPGHHRGGRAGRADHRLRHEAGGGAPEAETGTQPLHAPGPSATAAIGWPSC